MRKILPLIAISCIAHVCQAQRLTFDQLKQSLNSSLNQAEENLFLRGYSFVEKRSLADSNGMAYTFSTRGKTVTTAKSVTKGVYTGGDIAKSYLQYVTYEPVEFQKLRKLMIEDAFIRSGADSISEKSTYRKENLEVNFATDNLNPHRAFIITLRNTSAIADNKVFKKLSLKNVFKR